MSRIGNRIITIPENVEVIDGLFKRCRCNSSFIFEGNNITDINGLNIITNEVINLPESVVNLNGIYDGYGNFNQPIDFLPNNIKAITNFVGVSFNQPVNFPDSVENISCFGFRFNFNQPVNLPANLKDMSRAFMYATNFNQELILPNGVENISFAFSNSPSALFDRGNLALPDSIISIGGLYANFTNDFELNIPSKVKDVSELLYNCKNFNHKVVLSDNVENAAGMLRLCSNFNNEVILGNNVINIKGMLDRTNFDRPFVITDSVKDCSDLFSELANYNSEVILGNNVTNISRMFNGCSNFNQPITIPANVINCNYAFAGTSSFGSDIYWLALNCPLEQINNIAYVGGYGFGKPINVHLLSSIDSSNGIYQKFASRVNVTVLNDIE